MVIVAAVVDVPVDIAKATAAVFVVVTVVAAVDFTVVATVMFW